MHMLCARNTKELSIFVLFIRSKIIHKILDITKKQHLLFDLTWKCQNVTKGGQIGYGWIQNIVSFPFVFIVNLCIAVFFYFFPLYLIHTKTFNTYVSEPQKGHTHKRSDGCAKKC